MDTEKQPYPITYWVNKEESIALVRMSDTKIQGWKALGRDTSLEFEHSHFQTIYPSKERLDEYLRKFDPSTVDEYLQYQFDQHSLDDYFREKARAFKERMAQQQNLPSTPPKQ